MENFVFSTINKTQTEDIVHSEHKRDDLRKIYKFTEDDEKSEILLDFYENLLSFCLKLDFTLEKISCSLAIMTNIVQNSISNSLQIQYSRDNFKSLLRKHSIQRPPFTIQVYSHSDIVALESFAEETFFKHYSLYSYGFTPHKDVIITTEKLMCARFPLCINLHESIEINPETIPELKKYLPRILTPKEVKQDLGKHESEIIEEQELDSVQALLNNEIKAIKNHMEEKVKKQDEEIFAKIELLKK